MRRRARAGMLAAALVVAAGVPVLGAAPAQAASYRYWTYWHGDSGSWTFSGVGASSWRVKDGSVEGWRFAVSPGTRSAPKPRYDAGTAFDRLCGDVAHPDGTARIALVLDFGTAEDARPGDSPRDPSLRGVCITVSSSSETPPASGLAVLNKSGTSVREDAGMICGLAGYPSAGCGEVVRDVTATPIPAPTRTPTPKPSTSRTPTPKPSTSATSTAAAPSASSSRPAGQSPSGSGSATATSGATSTPSPGASGPATSSTASASASVGGSSTLPGTSSSPDLVVGLASGSDPASDGGTPWPLVAGIGLVAALGGSAWWTSRRRGSP